PRSIPSSSPSPSSSDERPIPSVTEESLMLTVPVVNQPYRPDHGRRAARHADVAAAAPAAGIVAS
ncbi:MAG: hypothetical protein OXF25_01500, partial [Cyanobacteria bacterium MAG CAR3_bin_5]|nr:hypothetical protein [Cyanobacteria bacterium MAG CAR3_bin_5]